MIPPFRAKQTQFRAGQKEGQVPCGYGRGREETKPLWWSDEAGRGGGQDMGRSRPGRPRYWDPKRDRSRLGTHSWAGCPCYGQDFCAKQTQFGPPQGEEQAACGKGVMVDSACKRRRKNKANFLRKAIGQDRKGCAPPVGPVVQTNPIPATMSIGRSAVPRGQPCQTKPI
jgi:hypothetical protein